MGIIGYIFVCLLLRKCYTYSGVGMTNFIWSIASIITMLIVGSYIFHENITKNDIIGILICFVGLYFIFVMDHKTIKKI